MTTVQNLPLPSASPIPDDILARVSKDDSPSLLVCSNTFGDPGACNSSTRRFMAKETLGRWNDLMQASDCDKWSAMMASACNSQKPVSGTIRLVRFDHAIRSFAVRAEPRYNAEGTFVCHLISCLDVTELLDTGTDVSSNETTQQNDASDWHAQLVPHATVVSACADIIPDLLSSDADPMLIAVANKLTSASEHLRTKLRMLNGKARSSSSPD